MVDLANKLGIGQTWPNWHGQTWYWPHCGRLVLRQGAKVLSGSTQGIYPRHEVEDVGQQEQQGDRRDDVERDEVNGEVEEIRSNAHRTHET